MANVLKALGHQVEISTKASDKFQVNHHINYEPYREKTPNSVDSLMITHITTDRKMETVKNGMKTADIGICFSKETEDLLKDEGIKNLTTVLPAHDGYPMKPICVLISTNVYPDGCKRQEMFFELLKHIDLERFHFYIMGKDWELQGLNANIHYVDHFDQDAYEEAMGICQYNLYFGKDEGSMGVLDCKNVGLRIIAPLCGFHKEIGIDYPFDTQEELNAIFKQLGHNPVREWTWKNYCLQHLELWEKALDKRKLENYAQFNEEEIIDKIFKKIGTTNKFAVEFGCHLHNRFSNTKFLELRGWKVQQYGLEGPPLIHAFFTAENVNEIFEENKVPKDLDFMSIDIDGMDYWVWKAMEWEPRVVCIEYNEKRKRGVQKYQADYLWNGQNPKTFGASKEAMVALAKEKGYELVDQNQANLFFVKTL